MFWTWAEAYSSNPRAFGRLGCPGSNKFALRDLEQWQQWNLVQDVQLLAILSMELTHKMRSHWKSGATLNTKHTSSTSCEHSQCQSMLHTRRCRSWYSRLVRFTRKDKIGLHAAAYSWTSNSTSGKADVSGCDGSAFAVERCRKNALWRFRPSFSQAEDLLPEAFPVNSQIPGGSKWWGVRCCDLLWLPVRFFRSASRWCNYIRMPRSSLALTRTQTWQFCICGFECLAPVPAQVLLKTTKFLDFFSKINFDCPQVYKCNG